MRRAAAGLTSVLALASSLSLALALFAPGPAAAAQAPQAQDRAAAEAGAGADRQLLERVLEETGVAREPPGPSVTGYLMHLGETAAKAVSGTLLGFLEGAVDLVGGLGPALRVVIWLAAGCVVLWLAWMAVQLWQRRARRAGPDAAVAPAGPALPPPGRPVAALRADVEARLAEGRIAEALEALWWWLARTLAGEAADVAWTTRELLARAPRGRGRPLGPLARALDAMIYGPRRPGGGEVRAFLDRLEEALA